jgi:hypothetical protein
MRLINVDVQSLDETRKLKTDIYVSHIYVPEPKDLNQRRIDPLALVSFYQVCIKV